MWGESISCWFTFNGHDFASSVFSMSSLCLTGNLANSVTSTKNLKHFSNAHIWLQGVLEWLSGIQLDQIWGKPDFDGDIMRHLLWRRSSRGRGGEKENIYGTKWSPYMLDHWHYNSSTKFYIQIYILKIQIHNKTNTQIKTSIKVDAFFCHNTLLQHYLQLLWLKSLVFLLHNILILL